MRDFLGITELNPTSIRKLHDASPVTHIAAGMPPYLLIHGTKDEQVPYDQSPEMCEKMKAAGNECEVFTVEGGAHGIGSWEKDAALQKYKVKMVEWLDETMK
jgi:alpha-L-fucosidase 2